MIIQKSKALKMKYEALWWLRVKQRCMFIATEVGAYSSDVLGINEKKMIEIEVKTTFEDFKNDFQKHKHYVYSGKYQSDYEGQWVPTHFYFVVPPELVDQVKKYLESDRGYRTKDYGIISLQDWKVIKRAKWLHKREPNNRVKCTTALRMGSELLRFHEAWL